MFADGTIVAQASAQGAARRGIIRVSGENALRAVEPFFVRSEPGEEFPPEKNPRTKEAPIPDPTRPQIVVGWFMPWGETSPARFARCALFFWPRGRGFTGEEAVELHLPGSPALLDAATRTLCKDGLARLAGPGEFTMRAFLSGRIDLTQAEAVLGAIDASSDVALRTALAQLSGALSREFSELRELLLDALSELEAGFDFVDEDIEFISKQNLIKALEDARERIDRAVERAMTGVGEDLQPRVVLAGAPNSGKSSLFNRLTSEYSPEGGGRALVSDVAGTTRDYLESELVADGTRFTLVDTAGADERMAQEAGTPDALAQTGLADVFRKSALILRCRPVDAEDAPATLPLPAGIPVLDVATKCDLAGRERVEGLAVSSESGEGTAALIAAVSERLHSAMDRAEIVPSTAVRCQESLRGAREALGNALELLTDAGLADDFAVASELRLALDQIGLITGQVHTDDLLDRIFSRFCIGK